MIEDITLEPQPSGTRGIFIRFKNNSTLLRFSIRQYWDNKLNNGFFEYWDDDTDAFLFHKTLLFKKAIKFYNL